MSCWFVSPTMCSTYPYVPILDWLPISLSRAFLDNSFHPFRLLLIGPSDTNKAQQRRRILGVLGLQLKWSSVGAEMREFLSLSGWVLIQGPGTVLESLGGSLHWSVGMFLIQHHWNLSLRPHAVPTMIMMTCCFIQFPDDYSRTSWHSRASKCNNVAWRPWPWVYFAYFR